MIPDITNALLLAGGAAVGALCKVLFDERGLYKIPKDRRRAISGSWEGRITNIPAANDPPPPFATNFSCTLVARRKKVTGEGHLVREGTGYCYTFTGDFQDLHYIRLEYNRNTPMSAFGHIILRLDDQGTSMSGKFVGYGSGSGKINVGMVEIKKMV